MIIVDIFVPSVDKTYNFSLNESVKIASIIDEVVEMIEQKEKVSIKGDKKELNVFEKIRGVVLPADNTLFECSIKNGDFLILV
jgi:uncharacterized ubiquitin-like protein YukD